MAVPTIVSANGSAGSTLTPPGNWQTTQDKDIMILSVGVSGTSAADNLVPTPSGWNLLHITAQAGAAAASYYKMWTFWKRCGAAEAAPGFSFSGYRFYVQTLVRGCLETATPIHLDGTNITGSAVTSISMSLGTTTQSDCAIVYHVGTERNQSTAWISAESNANLTGVAENYDACVTGGSGNGVSSVTGTLATAGDTGTMTATVASSYCVWSMVALLSTTSSGGGTTTVNAGRSSLLGVGY